MSFYDWIDSLIDKFMDEGVRQEERQNSLLLMQRDKDFYDGIAKIVQRIWFICLLIFYSFTILPFVCIAIVIFGLPYVLLMCFCEKTFSPQAQIDVEYERHKVKKIRKDGNQNFYLYRGYILWLGRIAPEKRLEWLIEAYRILNPNVLLVIAGFNDKPNSEYEKTISNMIDGVPGIIKRGYVDGKTKALLLANTRLFVLPSSTEACPTALLEAMNYRRPCLVGDLDSLKEIIEDNVSGFLFKHNSFDSFLFRLKEVLAL